MAMPAERLSTARSESALSVNSRLSDARRAKLMDLKKREDLKDQLTEKFKGRFGHGGTKEADEVSIASGVIAREVEHFSRKASVSEGNLGRLERRLLYRAQGKANDELSAVSGAISGVSAYTGLTGLSQRSKSATSLAGRNVVQARKHDWSKLDEYASYLHEQDALRQKLGVQALQRKLKMDLDAQVNEKLRKQNEALEEEKRYHQNSLMELERWKQQEQQREEEKHLKVQKQKQDRDDQMKYERQLKQEEEQKKKDEEAALVEKIVNEMEADQKRFEKKKMQTKKAMRKVFEENAEDQRKRDNAAKEAREKEAATMKEYNRILDEQEEQRAQELADRMERQASLMKKLQANVDGLKKESGDGDAKRAQAQQEEQDRHFFEAEAVKQNRLAQMRVENQAYLLKQMEEKDGRKDEDKYLSQIQAQILLRDTEEYNAIEKQKVIDRKLRNAEHQKDIVRQMEYKQRQSVPEMSQAEIQLNRPLLELVEKTLTTRDENATKYAPIPEGNEDDY
eukprot:gb/GFBE01005301.1/.p1 GENE.gb/GFBE01005301.1/~~gb/GFBE01005301.1/.p1  ORF type:complete len:510 (+),score=199.82 gb/GFBE01005301.1/:1-1530(+)